MHLNKLLEQIRKHPEVMDKAINALEDHEHEIMEKAYTSIKESLFSEMYEAVNGPHFNEEYAKHAVEHMENEDGSKGPHWSVEETTSVANQMGINLKSGKCNKWDWYVAMNMIYSDFYKAVLNITGNSNAKYFAELTKAWLHDKDIEEGKMWNYYIHIMCDGKDKESMIDKQHYRYYSSPSSYYHEDDDEYGRYRYGRYNAYESVPSHYRYGNYEIPYDRYDTEIARRRVSNEDMGMDTKDREIRNTSVRYF